MTELTRFSLEPLVDETLWLDEVESTNTFLSDRDLKGSAVALSWHQTGGRGRLGRKWESPEGGSLALSVALWPELVPQPLTAEWLGALALVAGASLAGAIRPHVAEPVRFKWPNDVLIGVKKVAGILGEVSGDGRVVVGVGLNVSLKHDQLPTDLATSLTLHEFEPARALENVIVSFLRELRGALSGLEGGLTGAKRVWVAEQCDTLGREVRVEFPGGLTRQGKALDIDRAGRLLVHFDDNNVVEPIDSADVIHLRPAN